jgi:hypothetical protein
MSDTTVSLIVPCWKDHEAARTFAENWAEHPLIHEVVVAGVGGGPPINHTNPKIKRCVTQRPGRGVQMNLGAQLATGEVLLFHHVDSILTDAHLRSLVRAMRNGDYVGGAFYRKFDERHPCLRWLEKFERVHCRAFGTIYGDQSVFIRRSDFGRLGGFAPIPLMEDVDLSGRLRRSGKIVLLDPPMRSSAKKQIEQGAWRVTLRNLLFLVLFRAGVSALRLHDWYYLKKRGRWRARWNAFRNPIDPEKARVLRDRWNSLPPELRTANQISGRHLTHCGFILGASYCSFHCTHCYLPKNANRVPIPMLADMKEQIDANRRFQGPGGGLQITGGDVVDAYWKSGRTEQLIEIIRYAYQVGLVPMLMTHGQTLLEHPEFLERLVFESGLRQISVHIDLTQAGRHGYPIQRVKRESDLHPLREAFTRLARDLRQKSGVPLEYALSFTVTQKNIDDVPDVVRWYVADPERTQIWRMLSFQPEADNGRTIFSEQRATPERVWEKICEGTGLPLERHATNFGHPDCNSCASLLISRRTGRMIPLLPTDLSTKRLLGEILEKVGGLSFVTDDAGTIPWRMAGIFVHHPGLAFRSLVHLATLVLSGRIPAGMIVDLIRGRAHTLGIGTHNFMDAEQVTRADSDPVVGARLDSCVFKGAVKETGEWRAVPMCKMNQQKWSEIYEQRLRNSALMSKPQAFETVERGARRWASPSN